MGVNFASLHVEAAKIPTDHDEAESNSDEAEGEKENSLHFQTAGWKAVGFVQRPN
jgi:hypothetical protein